MWRAPASPEAPPFSTRACPGLLGPCHRRLEGVRQLHRLPPTAQLGAQPRCFPGGPRSLAGSQRRAAPRRPPRLAVDSSGADRENLGTDGGDSGAAATQRSASKRPAASTEIPSSPGWRSIWRRSGRAKAGLPSPDQGVGPRRAGPGNLSAKSQSMNPI